MEWEKQEQHHHHRHHHQQEELEQNANVSGNGNGNGGVFYVKVMTDAQVEILRKQISVYATICEQLVEMHKSLTSHQDLAGLPLSFLYFSLYPFCDAYFTRFLFLLISFRVCFGYLFIFLLGYCLFDIIFFKEKSMYGVCLWFSFSLNYFRVVLYLIFGLILHNCIFIVFSVWPFEVDLAFDPDNLDLSEEIISVINDLGFVLIMVWYNWTWGS